MGDMGDIGNALKDHRREMRLKHGIQCPRCKEKRPRAHASILLPGQRCKVDGYVDQRPRLGSNKPRASKEDSQMELLRQLRAIAEANGAPLLKEAADCIVSLAQDKANLRRALRFYADRNVYRETVRPNGQYFGPAINADKGDMARIVLTSHGDGL